MTHYKLPLWMLAVVVCAAAALGILGARRWSAERDARYAAALDAAAAAAETEERAEAEAARMARERDALRIEAERLAEENALLRAELEESGAELEALRARYLSDEELETIRRNHTMTKHYAKTAAMSKLGYWLYTPNLTEDNRGLPLLVYLHGSSGLGTELNRVIRDHSLSQGLAEDKLYPNCLVLLPQCSRGNWDVMRDDVMQLVRMVAEEYDVDLRRISLSGASLGGMSCWRYLADIHGVFSACVPVGSTFKRELIPDMEKDVPIWAFQGTADDIMGPVMPWMTGDFEEGGYDVRFTQLQDQRHAVQWIYTDPDYGVVDWLISQERETDALLPWEPAEPLPDGE